MTKNKHTHDTLTSAIEVAPKNSIDQHFSNSESVKNELQILIKIADTLANKTTFFFFHPTDITLWPSVKCVFVDVTSSFLLFSTDVLIFMPTSSLSLAKCVPCLIFCLNQFHLPLFLWALN